MPNSPENPIAHRFADVRARIDAACARFGRDPASVHLLAVAKAQPLEALQAAIELGHRQFGESYVQEALAKLDAIDCADCEWHFIGPLQSNKTARVAERFDWVHSVDRLKIARRLSEQRPEGLAPLQICLQVNVSGEASKSGMTLAELPALAREVANLPRLRLRGLMAIPEKSTDFDVQRAAFRRVREAADGLRQDGLALDTLSMAMSGDLEAAVAEGATMIRIGTALFGARPPRPPEP